MKLHPRWPRTAILTLALWAASGQSAPLPNLGDDSGITLSLERQQGDQVVRELYRDPDYVDDPILAEYVQSIWQPLLAAARSRGELSPEQDERFAWDILMGRDSTINAFALPGGYLGLNLGLIAAVSSPDELASVLAHELSHVTQRHISRMTSQQSRQAPWMLAALVLAALAASKNPEAANALMVGGQAAAIQTQLKFSRDMEREADRIGFGVMSEAGFAPQGFVTMFEKLQHAARLNDDGSYPYLRSHPLTTERIADMQARQPGGARPDATAPADLTQALVSARARILTHPGSDALQNAVQQAADPALNQRDLSRRAATLYAAALAAHELHQPTLARQRLNELQTLLRASAAPASAQQHARWLQAELALADGSATERQAAIAALQAESPLPRASRWLLAQLYTATGLARRASDLLQPWLSEHPRDAAAWQAQSEAWTALGEQLSAVRAQGEVQMARLNYAGAADRFKAARELMVARSAPSPAQHMELSILDARLREVQSLLKQQAALDTAGR